MEEEKDFHGIVEEICAKDPRYKPDSYEFIMQALRFTQNTLKRKGHCNARELLIGIKNFCIRQYGPMSKAVLNYWGIYTTADFGNIVFNMLDYKLLSKSEQDKIGDFENGYDFESVFVNALSEDIKNLARG